MLPGTIFYPFGGSNGWVTTSSGLSSTPKHVKGVKSLIVQSEKRFFSYTNGYRR